MKQMQRWKLLLDAMKDWVDAIIKEGNKFILEFTNVYAEGESLLGEIQTLIPRWETKKNWCQVVIFQVTEVEKFGVLKFLNENPMKNVDLCMLFIMKITWVGRSWFIRRQLKKCRASKAKLLECTKNSLKI